MKKIFVAIPAYSGDICIQTMHSLLFAKEEASGMGWELKAENIHSRISDADIGLARNAFLGWFLDSDCTDLLFIDSDISWDRGVFTHLFSHDVDFVAGAYRAKRDDKEIYPVLWPEKRSMCVDAKSGKPLIEVDGIGFGFARLSRAGVEKIDKTAQRHFQDPLIDTVKCPWLFEFAFDGEQRKSEDYIFCKRWREAGMKIWLDPSICVDHTGKKTYQGDIYSAIKRETFALMNSEEIARALSEKAA